MGGAFLYINTTHVQGATYLTHESLGATSNGLHADDIRSEKRFLWKMPLVNIYQLKAYVAKKSDTREIRNPKMNPHVSLEVQGPNKKFPYPILEVAICMVG